MKVWQLVSPPSGSMEGIQTYKTQGFIAVALGGIGDLKQLNLENVEAINKHLSLSDEGRTYPAYTGQVLWGFFKEMIRGDLVIVRSGRHKVVMEITGDYYWEPESEGTLSDHKHRRGAKVIEKDPKELEKQFNGLIQPWKRSWPIGLYGEISEPLNGQEISEIVGRYQAKRSSFEKLASEVQRRVVDRLRDKGIRNMVTARAKAPESLHKKLWKERNKRSMRTFEDSLSPPLKDLAGVRVLLYLPEDIEPAVDTLKEIFQGTTLKTHQNKDGYRAEHLYVRLNTQGNQEDASLEWQSLLCEIQICTITDHIWNELEHDIFYKQPGGKPDEGQKELLWSLHQMLSIASQTVDRLMKRTKGRILENSEPILEPDDLQVYLTRKFKALRGDFGSLLELLKTLMSKVSPSELDRLFQDGWDENHAKEEARYWDPNGSERELGWIAMMLLPGLGEQEIIDATERDDGLPPLLNMLRRAAKKHIGGKP